MNILRPLSPHLPIYKPQLTSTFPISHRISGAFLATIVFFFHLLYLKIGLICFTYENVYLFFFYSSKLILISVEITAFALSYHLYNGVRILYNHRILNKVEYSTTTFNIMLFVGVLYGLLYILGSPLQFSGMGTPIHIMGTLPAVRFTLLH
uniref:succinate dehydrogenase subunit 3 n=1 Tax=Primulina hunanensis TaxID=1846138 RepID=UPI0030FE61DF